MKAEGEVDFPIRVEGLSKTYRVGFLLNKLVRALKGIDLQVPRGQIYGLLGPNGAGKSTTIKILLDLVKPSGGRALLFDQPPRAAQARARVGFVPENPAPYGYLTGREFVTLAGHLAGLTRHELDQRVTTVLGEVGLTQAAALQIRRYSKGMVQRVALAQAMVAKPRLLILDEPTSGLDPLGRREVRDLIIAQREQGATVLFCTHIIPDVEAVCDRIAVLVSGELRKEGPLRELVGARGGVTEVAVEGVTAEQVGALGVPLVGTTDLSPRLLLRVAEADVQVLLGKLLGAGAAVRQVHPVTFGLEELFFEAMKDAGRKVGSEVTA